MAPEVSTQRELQEKSIKARKHELFVEEQDQDGPRKTFREYLKETPATPLSKNVKLMLWGAAVPVAFLFFAAMLTSSRSAPVKAPSDLVVPVGGGLTSAPHHSTADRNNKPPDANPDKSKGDKPKSELASNSNSNKPPDAKDKPKSKKPKKSKKDAKKSTEVAKKTDEANKDKDKNGEDEGEKKTSKSGAANQNQAKDAKAKAAGNAPSSTPEKPKRSTGPSLFKTKRPPVYTYPKKGGEKKDESKDTSDNPLPGLIPEPDPGASRP